MAPVDISIVVPLDCPTRTALSCLQALGEQPANPTFEVIVVVHGAPWLDGLLSQLDGDVEVVRSDRRLAVSDALAAGAARARAPHLVLLPDAGRPQRDWLAPLLAALADPMTAVAAAVSAEAPDAPVAVAPALALRTADAPQLSATAVADPLALAAAALALSQDGRRARAIDSSRVVPAVAPAVRGDHAPGTPAQVTIVIPTLDAGGERVRRSLTVLAETTEVPHQVVLVDNGAPPQGFSGPVNIGVRGADTEYVVVMNDDVEPFPGWWPPLRAALDAGAEVVFPLTVDGAMREDFAAWCFALRRDAVDRIGYGAGTLMHPELVIWFQDTDLYTRLCSVGRPPLLVTGSRIRHGLSRTLTTPDPALATWIAHRTEADRRRYCELHPDAVLRPIAL